MTIFAGIYARHDHADWSLQANTDADRILANISRSGDRVDTFRAPRLFLAKVDLGIYGEPAFQNDSQQLVAAAAGNPLFRPDGDRHLKRDQQLVDLAQQALSSPDALREAVGTFALVIFDPHSATLSLATDAFGTRPLYIYEHDDFVYFSTAIRVLEQLDGVPKCMDSVAVAEISLLRNPLGTRTPYADIQLMGGGCVRTYRQGSAATSEYLRWDDVGPADGDPKDYTQRVFDVFLDTVRCRLTDKEPCIATLSGGLDSRCVVAALQALGKDVLSVTFETRGRMDHEMAVAYAQAAGVRNMLIPFPRTQAPQSATARLRDVISNQDGSPLSSCVFTGDNGGIQMGYVNVQPALIEFTRRRDHRGAADWILKSNQLPRKVMIPSSLKRLEEAIEQDLLAEFERLRAYDPARHAQIFYLNNHVRRNLHESIENIDLSRVELTAPMLDSRFMNLLLSLPNELFPRHAFYHEWLECFPPSVSAISWQTYPRHLPCPVPWTGQQRDQWTATRADGFAAQSASFQAVRQRLSDRRGFPGEFFRRSRLRLAVLLHALRVNPYGYVFDAYLNFEKYYARSSGKVSF